MEWMSHGVTSPKGFYSAGMHIGVKRKRKDMSMIYSESPCEYAGVFTRNVVKAAPVLWNMDRLKDKDKIHGVIVNSGNANACTGEKGMKDADKMALVFAQEMGCDKEQVLVASTGVIGVPLPMDTIKNGILEIVKKKDVTREAAHEAAEGIMTTDTFTKEAAVTVVIDGKKVTLAGMSKGSGMIHPNMGTMLAFITTDAVISQENLEALLKSTVDDTYNMISVDGDTSTNDMVLVLANGQSGTGELVPGSEGFEIFKEAFHKLSEKLSKLIVKDGEGVTKFIEVHVAGMTCKAEARKMVHAVITSNLVKTAFFGEDANWGRILCALGYSGAIFDPMKIQVKYQSDAGEIILIDEGAPVAFDEDFALEILKETDIRVEVSCNQGESEATVGAVT